jgi:hypothetical protein
MPEQQLAAKPHLDVGDFDGGPAESGGWRTDWPSVYG